MRHAILSSSLLLSVATLGLAQARPTDEAGIRRTVAAYEAGVNAHDVGAITAVFAPDADAIYFDSPRNVGREAIAANHREALADWPPERTFSLTVTNIRSLSPQLALVETDATFSQGDMRSNRGTILMARRNGAWQWVALRVYPAEKR